MSFKLDENFDVRLLPATDARCAGCTIAGGVSDLHAQERLYGGHDSPS